MNVAMLGLGAISSSVNAGKMLSQTLENNNTFSSLLMAQNSNVGQSENSSMLGNLTEALNQMLKILKDGFPVSNEPDFTINEKISDEQVSNLLGITKEESKDQLNSLIDSLLGLFSNVPQIITQLNDAKKMLDQGNNLEGMTDLASSLTKLPAETFKQLNGNQLLTLAKNVKAVEMLANTVDLSMGDINQLATLKDSIKNITTKIEALLKNNTTQTRNLILQNTFTTLVKNQQEVLTTEPEVKKSDVPVQENVASNLMNPISKTEQFILHVGKGQDSTPNYSEFVKDFTNILAKSQLTTGQGGTNKLFIKLYPENLGSIRIELLQDKGNITAKMIASSGAAKDLLDSEMHQLRNAFSMQNIQVDKIDVVYGQTDAQKFEHQDPRQQSSNQERQAPEKEKEDEKDTQFLNLLSESLLEKIV